MQLALVTCYHFFIYHFCRVIYFFRLFYPTHPSLSLNGSTAIYLHGYVPPWLMKLPASNEDLPETPISGCIAATHVDSDGIVLAVTPFNHRLIHSNNYRSAIIHGWANIITDAAEKLYALEQITRNLQSLGKCDSTVTAHRRRSKKYRLSS